MTSRAFSLIELLIALAIFSMTLIAVSLVAFGTPQALLEARQELFAAETATALLDRARLTTQQDLSMLSAFSSTTESNHTYALSVDPLADEYAARVTAHVSWLSLFGGVHILSRSELLTDPQDAANSEPCDPVLSGDWTKPHQTTYHLSPGDLLPSSYTLGTRTLSSVRAFSHFLFVTISASASKTDPTFFVFDISDRAHAPVLVGSLDTAPSTKVGLADSAFAFPYVFLANAFAASFDTCRTGPSCAQLQVIDVSVPSLPALVAQVTLSTTTAPFATGSGGQSIGNTITYHTGYVYLGLTKTSTAQGMEFNILSVSDPLHPVWKGGYHIGRSVTHTTIARTIASLTTDDPTQELLLLSTKDTAAPSLLARWNAPGSTGFGYGSDVASASSTLYVGRTYVSNAPEFSILSFTGSSLSVLGSVDTGTALTPKSVVAIRVRDFLATLLTSTDIEFFSVKNAPSPTSYALSIPLPVGTTGQSLACSGNTFYIGANDAGSNGTITLISSS